MAKVTNKGRLEMPKKLILPGLAILILLSGCATAGKSSLLGGIIGSAVGGSLGGLVSQDGSSSGRTRGVLIGAAAGGALGALIGNDTHTNQEKKKFPLGAGNVAPTIEIFGSRGLKEKQPRLKPAQVQVRYVEDQVKDGVLIPAHFEYEIAEPARWEP
jgi:hypothetical protein